MKIRFFTSTWDLPSLKSDYSELCKNFTLPCQFDVEINSRGEVRNPEALANCHYEQQEKNLNSPEIEFNGDYYSFKDPERLLIMFHEIIHACQRSNELTLLNDNFMVKEISNLNEQIHTYYKIHGKDSAYYVKCDKAKVIAMFLTWPFEIWDEMYLKTHYPAHLEEKLRITFETIEKQFSPGMYDGYGNWSKYPIFAQMVRTYFLQKISNGLEISKQFEKLFQKWNGELKKKNTSGNELAQLTGILEDLTDIDAYTKSDYSSLEKAYSNVASLMKKSF